MKPRSILVVDGHPDPESGRLCHALAGAYAEGAERAGHRVDVVRIVDLDIRFLTSKDEFENQRPAPSIQRVQQAIEGADHVVLVYPLWLGTMPAMLKAFLEQVFRPGFAFGGAPNSGTWARRLTGKSARVIVTMGMPALFYRWYFRAHSLKSLERNILNFCGIKPVRETLLGMVESATEARRGAWMHEMRELGARAR